jgi:hypothetical protein
MAKKAPGSLGELEALVDFGGVSIGDESARLGMRLDINALSLSQAYKMFAGARLAISLVLFSDSESSDQQELIKGIRPTLQATVDVNGFRVTRKNISIGCKFSIGSTDVKLLSQFAKRKGRLVVSASEAIESEGEAA